MAPLTRSRATLERVPTPMMGEHYVQRAAAGLIIAEATNVGPQSIAWDCAPGIFTPAQIDAWAKVVRAVHDAGGRIALQLWHGGRVACDRSPDPKPALSPSGVNENMDAITVWGLGPEGKFTKLKATPSREMTPGEIKETIQAFGAAARACREVGLTRSGTARRLPAAPVPFAVPQPPQRRYSGTPRSAPFPSNRAGMTEHYPPARVSSHLCSDYNGMIDPIRPRIAPGEPSTASPRLGRLADTSFWYSRFERSRVLDLVKPVFDGR
jgi:hypothetical protein